MKLNGTMIEDTFAEAFEMWACRLIITAVDDHWAQIAAVETTGYGTSIIGCDAEAGVEHPIDKGQTPDGRAGRAVLLFARHLDSLSHAVANRVGQCALTCPTTALYDGMQRTAATGQAGSDLSNPIDLGRAICLFGDGYEESFEQNGRLCWRIPVMDGWFVVEESASAIRAVGGGNFLISAADPSVALQAARHAVDAIAPLTGVITPFPGGVVRSGSKVGAQRNQNMIASTNEVFCPTLGRQVASKLRPGVNCVYEIVVDGLSHEAVAAAMRAGIQAACGDGVIAISAGNYEGKLGKIRFGLQEIMAEEG